MAAGKLVASALFVALAATATTGVHDSTCEAARPASALVLRAGAPLALGLSVGRGHGEASFRVPFVGRRWHVALAWSSAHGHVRAGLAIAARAEE